MMQLHKMTVIEKNVVHFMNLRDSVKSAHVFSK